MGRDVAHITVSDTVFIERKLQDAEPELNSRDMKRFTYLGDYLTSISSIPVIVNVRACLFISLKSKAQICVTYIKSRSIDSEVHKK
jgi:hypothetical protein